MKCDNAPRGNRNFFTGFGIATGPLRLVAQLEIPKSGQFDRLAALKCQTHFFKESLDHVLGLTLVETNLLEQHVGEFCFG